MNDVMRIQTLRDAAAVMCYGCAHEGNPTYNGNAWVHLDKLKANKCSAAAIHDLILSTQQPNKVKATNESRGRRPEMVYRFVVMFNRATGRMPSLREIVEATDITSTSIANLNLQRLENAGLIRRIPFTTRGIELTRPLFYKWLPEIEPDHDLSPCGHPAWAIVSVEAQDFAPLPYCHVCEFIESIRPVNSP